MANLRRFVARESGHDDAADQWLRDIIADRRPARFREPPAALRSLVHVRARLRWREFTVTLVLIAVLASGLAQLSWLVTHPAHGTHQESHAATAPR